MLKEFIDCGTALVAVVEFELSGKRDLVLDLTDVSFMDSAGIGLIIGRWKNVNSIGGKTAVAGCGQKLKKIIELGGVGRLMGLYPDYRSAVKEFMK